MPDIYLLSLTDEEFKRTHSHEVRHVFDTMTIRAWGCERARKLAERLAREWDAEDPGIWLDHTRVTCERLHQSGAEEVLDWSAVNGCEPIDP